MLGQGLQALIALGNYTGAHRRALPRILTVTVDIEQPVEIETRSVENRQPVRTEAIAFQAIRH